MNDTAWRLSFLIFSFAGSLGLLHVSAQGYTTDNKKAIKLFESAQHCMQIRDWKCAEGDLRKAREADPKFVEPRIALAEVYGDIGNEVEAIGLYREAIAINPRFYPLAILHLAELEFRNRQYDEAEAHFRQYKQVDDDPERRARVELGLKSCAFAREATKNPVPFDPVNCGPGVNTEVGEYYPCVTADDKTLLFTRRVKDPSIPEFGAQEDFYVSHRNTDGSWSEAAPIPRVDTKLNEGAGTLTPDGRFIVFTKCAGDDGVYGPGLKGMGSCDLFISRRVGDRWSVPENLGSPVNSSSWESQPSMGSDGRTLYFVRGARAGMGITNQDIYVSRLQDDGSFGKPEKLGATINTPGQEESVQIHPDGRTLFFSSNGHPGMGGLDIFFSRLQDDGQWGPAQNLGYPINSSADENSLLVNSQGDIAFFASERPGGFGDLDLYTFPLPEYARPTPVTYIRGHVYDRTTKAPVEADVELFDLASGKLATAAYSDPQTGEFLVCLPTGHDYALSTGAEGFLFFSQNYSIASTSGSLPFDLDVPLSPLKPGERIELRNIFFETARFDLLPTSNAELDKLLKLLELNPTLRIELGGHTDNVGDDKSNQQLSEQRAASVRSYLISKGIDGARITSKGYGETKPLASNDSEEGRAQNRRTEVVVL